MSLGTDACSWASVGVVQEMSALPDRPEDRPGTGFEFVFAFNSKIFIKTMIFVCYAQFPKQNKFIKQAYLIIPVTQKAKSIQSFSNQEKYSLFFHPHNYTMNPTLPYKKHSLSTKIQMNIMLRKQARHHEKSNSMMDFLQVKGNDRQNQLSQRAQMSTTSSKQDTVEEMVEKQFIALKSKVQIYCKQFNKFSQHQQMEKCIQQQGSWISSPISEEDIFSLFVGRIGEFMRESGLLQNNQQRTPQKLPYVSSSSNSFNVQSMNMTGETEELQRIQNIQVLEVYNKSRYHRRHTEKDFPLSAEPQHQLSGATQPNYASNFINSLPIACSSTISEILYKQARLRTFPEFHTFCQRILLDKKPVISDFHFFKKEKLDKTNLYLGQICRKLNILNTKLALTATGDISFVKRESFGSSQQKDKGKNIGRQIDEICIVLKKLNQLHNLNSLVFGCTRPCCKSQQPPQTTSTKAKILLNLKQSAKKSLHYNTQITQQYFNRYYRNESFDRTRIYSLTKTKTQEMERLQKTYYRMKGNKKTCKKRCNSLFENIA